MKLSAVWQWVIVLTALAVGLAACHEQRPANQASAPAGQASASASQPKPFSGAPSAEPAPTADASASPASTLHPEAVAVDVETARQVYAASNCAMCHGRSQEGGKLGPPLTGLSRYGWDGAQLQTFLRDPNNKDANPKHLAQLKGSYTMKMPAFTGTDEELRTLVEWLLVLPGSAP
jgi:mono/diheme cytochrome c family protein